MIDNITLEMSLKPFRRMTEEYVTETMRGIFEQWRPLIREARVISVLLWTADGSEILEYRGNMEETVQWCDLVGGANPRSGWNRETDPEGLGLHTRNYPYMEDCPILTYGKLKMIIEVIKEVGRSLFPDKTIRVGETFDPGPEFAKSPFKYEKHNEICVGESMGKSSMVCCYSLLHEDTDSYAGFHDGIAEGTPFGTFLGKQSQIFLTDMGFDYLWLSNGLGFGTETWGTTGAIFDGESFHTDQFQAVREKVLGFWKLFRQECPDFPLETRGTNLSAGIDYATDGVPLKDIYEGGFRLLPPPNSPWAALDGDFGLELAGYMSRISQLPGKEFLFRYYIHDPWWANSPWYDRYEGQPHDIYLPLAIGRIDENGKIQSPTHMNFLTIDNSFGECPDSCVEEPLPHLKRAIKELPDEPSPFVWVYPFDEYMDCIQEQGIEDMFAGDWFIRGALNEGFPLSSVVSTRSFTGYDDNRRLYWNSVLVSAVPQAGSDYERSILDYVRQGGKVIFYGAVRNAGKAFLELFGLELMDELEGIMKADYVLSDRYNGEKAPEEICHRSLVSGGGMDARVREDAVKNGRVELLATIGGRAAAVKNGEAVWVRGTVSAAYTRTSRLLEPDAPEALRHGEALMRLAAGCFGYTVSFRKKSLSSKSPVIMVHKSDKAFLFSVYSPDTTVETCLRFPFGAPVLMGYETFLERGAGTYRFPRAEHRECRIFVEQEQGIVGARELPPVSYQMRRRIQVTGLDDAVVRFFPEHYCGGDIQVVCNSNSNNYFVGDAWEGEYHPESGYFEVRHVTGEVVFSMPRTKRNH